MKILEIAGGFRDNVNGVAVSGGVPSFLNNYCMKVRDENKTFDFLTVRNQCFEPYREAFEAKGWSLYSLGIEDNGLKKAVNLVKKLEKFLKENKYDAVHINMGAFFPVLECAIAAKRAKVRIVIAHSHSTGLYSKKKRIVANIFSPLLTHYADKYCACSLDAARNLFSNGIIKKKKYKIIRNAINVDKYTFDPEVRKEIRQDLGIGDSTVVIGHVGRFVDVKNHAFLVRMFEQYHRLNPDSVLMMIGDGELKADIEKQVKESSLDDCVKFMGQRTDAYRFYQAMDVFVLPSTVEGLGLVAVEAQASGLPCYASKNVPKEAGATGLFRYFDLKSGEKQLAETIENDGMYRAERRDMSGEIIKAGYDLEESIREFEALYE